MKHFLLIPLWLMTFSFAGSPQANKIESVYTDLSVKTCKELEAGGEDGILYRGECRGVGGYKLILLESEHHQSLNLVAPNGYDEFKLNFALSAAPSSLGDKAEWRVRRAGNQVKPVALIARLNVFDDPDDRQKALSYLVVNKIAGGTACVTDVVKPGVENQDTRARELADAAAEKPCLIDHLESDQPAANEFSAIEEFVKFATREDDPLWTEAKGDLNGDGLDDWAGVIRRKNSEGWETGQIYILLRQKQGGFSIAERSKEETISTNCCYIEALEIKRSSLYLQFNSKTHGSVEASTYQFKLYGDYWRLIGLENFFLEIGPDESIKTSRNLLTGAVVESRQKGERKPIIRRRQKEFSTYFLRDFNFGDRFGIE